MRRHGYAHFVLGAKNGLCAAVNAHAVYGVVGVQLQGKRIERPLGYLGKGAYMTYNVKVVALAVQIEVVITNVLFSF